MPVRKITRLLIPAILATTLAGVVYTRGFGWRLGAAPVPLEGNYSTEEGWIVGEIVRDIAEMSAYPATSPVEVTVAPVVNEAGKYRVAINGIAQSADLDLQREVWNPVAFSAVARTAMSAQPSPRQASVGSSIAVHVTLVDLTPASLISASASVSKVLETNMRDAPAHEAAALTLGAFALRESAARFGDTRWAMNRMTAHLAMANALAGGAAPDIDGRLAEAVLLTLANHQTRALTFLGRLTTPDASRAVDSWIRALRLRITQDWRAVPLPARATLIEKNEYFRARRATVRSTKGSVELERLGEQPDANWIRIMQSFSMGVEDGSLLTEALDWEVKESQEVYQGIHGRPLGWNVSGALNTPATRLVGEKGPEVLPWGAWAEFAQRHLSMFVGRTDAFYRHSLGSDAAADQEKRRLRSELGTLWMFPAATIWWTKRPRGVEADLHYINEAIDRSVANPERVPAMAWSFMETGAKFEPVRRGMPPARSWFMRPTPRAMYDAAARIKDSGHPLNVDDLTAMMRDAPYDYLLAGEYLTSKYGENPPYHEIIKVAGPRRDYDLRVLRSARQRVEDDTERLSLLRRSCEVSAAECIALGDEHAKKGRDDEAAASYERAFADPTLDAISMSNASGWLVAHYYRNRRIDPALKLAERSAKTQSFQGLVTLAYLYERLARWDDAEEVYQEAADHYDSPYQLIGFYYRAVNVRRQMAFQARLATALASVFPNGLVPVTTHAARPAHGVVITKDNDFVRNAGLQAGDIVVGLEGWRVDNLRQYHAINALFEHDVMKLTAWRGELAQITLKTPNRLMGVEFRTYPVEGWGEQ